MVSHFSLNFRLRAHQAHLITFLNALSLWLWLTDPCLCRKC
uniref:Uncharacterized protein n=1 Tax=Anguilla anguilla TaxID=7936 RepID=A0A0E9R371_ANGAN